MRFPRFRLTLRRLMIAVAAVAISIAGGIEANRLWRLRDDYRASAAYHAKRENEERKTLSVIATIRNEGLEELPRMPVIEEVAHLRVEHHANLKQKYQRAATRPWQSVQPDPDDPGEELVWKVFEAPPLITDAMPLIEWDGTD